MVHLDPKRLLNGINIYDQLTFSVNHFESTNFSELLSFLSGKLLKRAFIGFMVEHLIPKPFR